MVGVIAVFLQWVRPRSSAMSIDVALSTRRGVGRDTYSLPQKRGYAASGTSMDMPPLHKRHLFFAAKTRLRPGAMSMDMALLSCAPGAMSTNSTSVGITKAMGKDYAESGHCCSMYCTYERGRIRLN